MIVFSSWTSNLLREQTRSFVYHWAAFRVEDHHDCLVLALQRTVFVKGFMVACSFLFSPTLMGFLFWIRSLVSGGQFQLRLTILTNLKKHLVEEKPQLRLACHSAQGVQPRQYNLKYNQNEIPIELVPFQVSGWDPVCLTDMQVARLAVSGNAIEKWQPLWKRCGGVQGHNLKLETKFK